MNKWKNIWNNRKIDEISASGNKEDIFLHLKSLMGVSSGDELCYDSFRTQFEANLLKMGGTFNRLTLLPILK